MKKALVIPTLGLALAVAACGNSSHHFTNQAAFETYVAGALHTDVRDVHCTKTSDTSASCETDEGTILIRCAWADRSGGHNCTARRRS